MNADGVVPSEIAYGQGIIGSAKEIVTVRPGSDRMLISPPIWPTKDRTSPYPSDPSLISDMPMPRRGALHARRSNRARARLGGDAGITLLMDDAAIIGDVRFLGGSLWTEFLFGSFSRTHAFRTA